MEPALKNRDYIIVKISDKNYERNDIVVYELRGEWGGKAFNSKNRRPYAKKISINNNEIKVKDQAGRNLYKSSFAYDKNREDKIMNFISRLITNIS